jgi:hypothetical protein
MMEASRYQAQQQFEMMGFGQQQGSTVHHQQVGQQHAPPMHNTTLPHHQQHDNSVVGSDAGYYSSQLDTTASTTTTDAGASSSGASDNATVVGDVVGVPYYPQLGYYDSNGGDGGTAYFDSSNVGTIVRSPQRHYTAGANVGKAEVRFSPTFTA